MEWLKPLNELFAYARINRWVAQTDTRLLNFIEALDDSDRHELIDWITINHHTIPAEKEHFIICLILLREFGARPSALLDFMYRTLNGKLDEMDVSYLLSKLFDGEYPISSSVMHELVGRHYFSLLRAVRYVVGLKEIESKQPPMDTAIFFSLLYNRVGLDDKNRAVLSLLLMMMEIELPDIVMTEVQSYLDSLETSLQRIADGDAGAFEDPREIIRRAPTPPISNTAAKDSPELPVAGQNGAMLHNIAAPDNRPKLSPRDGADKTQGKNPGPVDSPSDETDDPINEQAMARQQDHALKPQDENAQIETTAVSEIQGDQSKLSLPDGDDADPAAMGEPSDVEPQSEAQEASVENQHTPDNAGIDTAVGDDTSTANIDVHNPEKDPQNSEELTQDSWRIELSKRRKGMKGILSALGEEMPIEDQPEHQALPDQKSAELAKQSVYRHLDVRPNETLSTKNTSPPAKLRAIGKYTVLFSIFAVVLLGAGLILWSNIGFLGENTIEEPIGRTVDTDTPNTETLNSSPPNIESQSIRQESPTAAQENPNAGQNDIYLEERGEQLTWQVGSGQSLWDLHQYLLRNPEGSRYDFPMTPYINFERHILSLNPEIEDIDMVFPNQIILVFQTE